MQSEDQTTPNAPLGVITISSADVLKPSDMLPQTYGISAMTITRTSHWQIKSGLRRAKIQREHGDGLATDEVVLQECWVDVHDPQRPEEWRDIPFVDLTD